MIVLAKAAALAALRGTGALALLRHATRRRLRILAYHGAWILDSPRFGDSLFMPVDQFRERMRWLKKSRYPVIGLAEAVAGLREGRLAERSVVITLDDGWQSSWSHMLPVLEELRLPATIYVTTWYVRNRLPVLAPLVDWLHAQAAREHGHRVHPSAARARIARIEALPASARAQALMALSESLRIDPERWQRSGQFHLMSPDHVRDAHARGFDIQLHTHRHCEIGQQPQRLAVELEENRTCLAGWLPGKRFEHFCYPSGSFDAQAPAVLRRAGIASATLADSGLNAPVSDPWCLYRLMDGSSVSPALFSAWLSGITECRPRTRPGASAHH